MEAPNILSNLINWMALNKFSDSAISEFKMKWQSLNPSDGLPCPICYSDLDISTRLEGLGSDGCNYFIKCPRCRYYYKFTDTTDA